MKLVLAIGLLVLGLANVASAQPSQEEVFRSINQSVGQTTDPRKFLAVVLCIVAVALLLALLSHRRQRQAVPRPLNHHGKLMKEVLRSVPLRPGELRQLKLLAEEQSLSSPLTLLLCPSVLSRAVKSHAGKLDRRALLSVARKINP